MALEINSLLKDRYMIEEQLGKGGMGAVFLATDTAVELIRVLENLISNAVKFTPQGSVTCRARRADGQVVVSVIDTGIGIDPSDNARIFEKFTQAGNPHTDRDRGTGLGLPISKEIVEHHGGRIWVESELGQRSTFSFTLPASPAQAAQDYGAAERVESAGVNA